MRVGITFSAFDLLHAGHIDMLKQAKEQCDYLIVGLHTNPTIDRPKKNRPVQSTFERYQQLSGCKYVDEIIPYDTEEDLKNMLLTIKPDIRIIGEEYEDKDYTGRGMTEVFYNSRSHNYSSSSLRERVCKQKNN